MAIIIMNRHHRQYQYTKPETEFETFKHLALVCDSFDVVNQNYDEEDFVW